MIKISKILSEIKINPKITPEMVDQLDEEIYEKLSKEEYQEKIVKFINDFGYSKSNLLFKGWLKSLDKNKLYKLYHYFLSIKNNIR